jgi:hypothetical protein
MGAGWRSTLQRELGIRAHCRLSVSANPLARQAPAQRRQTRGRSEAFKLSNALEFERKIWVGLRRNDGR